MTSALPAAAIGLNQSRLEVFAKCERKFYLQYLARRHFPQRPDIPTREQEIQLAQGSLLHKYMERACQGVDRDALVRFAPTPIREWLEDACDFADQLPAGDRWAECTLAIPCGAVQLTARYDLLVLGQDGQALIVDWKTSAEPTPEARLRQRLQHAVFPYVLTESGLLGEPGTVEPARVEVIYWFTTDPFAPVRLRYSRAEHERNHVHLQDMVDRILARTAEEEFPKVDDTSRNRRRLCAFCSYMHYCDRSATPVTRVDLEEIFEEPPTLHLQDLLDDGQELDF